MSYSQALEQQLSLMAFMKSGRYEMSYDLMLVEPAAGYTQAAQQAIPHILTKADPYYWAPEICDLISTTSRTMPAYTLRPEDMPSPFGFCWFARKIALPSPDGLIGMADMTGFLWWADLDQVWFTSLLGSVERPEGAPGLSGIWQYGMDHEELIRIGLPTEPEKAIKGDTIDVDTTVSRAVGQMRIIACCLAFMQQQVLVTTNERADRPSRKRALASLKHEPLVRVVRLRRKSSAGPVEDDREPAEWSHRWIVSGHWRQQYYPSTAERRPLFILPYVKGPEDKPLKPPRAKVFAVVR